MPRLACLSVLLSAITSPAVPAAVPPRSPAWQAWRLGEEALRKGDAGSAVGQYRLALHLDPNFAPARLGLAAAHLDRGEDAEAAAQLARYVAERPDHVIVRAHYAEVLLRLGRLAEARGEFERFVADAQDRPGPAGEHVVHCETRLMELARRRGDDYEEHLHRGIGLYLLGCRRAGGDGPGGELSAEGLWCKAAAELTQARQACPGEARPCWYLHLVWERLGQSQPARRWLRAAEESAALGGLTPAEGRELHLACGRRLAEAGRK